MATPEPDEGRAVPSVCLAIARPRWLETIFVHETAERLLLGQVILHPERLPELCVTDDQLNGNRRAILRTLQAALKAGHPTDLVHRRRDALKHPAM